MSRHREHWTVVSRPNPHTKWTILWPTAVFRTRRLAADNLATLLRRDYDRRKDGDTYRIVPASILWSSPEMETERLRRKVPTCPSCGQQMGIHINEKTGRIRNVHLDRKERQRGFLMRCRFKGKPVMALRHRYATKKR